MRKNDPAHIATDKILKDLEKKIAKEYKQAYKEVTGKLNDHLARFDKKDEKWFQWVKEGKKTRLEYYNWRRGQIIMGHRWSALADQMAQTYTDAKVAAQKIARDEMLKVYAINHNYATYEIESQALRDTVYTLYNRESVARLLKDNPTLFKPPGRDARAAIARGEVKRWNRQQIQSIMLQGILQGESIPNLTKRLEKETFVKFTKKNHAAAIRDARTMATGVQNKGRTDAYQRAAENGIKTRRMWLATHDMRTRHAHRELDYVETDVDKPWENEIGKIMYPGDPSADAENIYNCRCTIRAVVVGLERKAQALRSDKKLEGMSYEEWKESRLEKYNKITLPEEKASAIRAAYIKEYEIL